MGVWQENEETVRAFFSISGQWRTAAAGVSDRPLYLGLDYAAAKAGLELAGFTITPEQWQGVRVMEDEILSILNSG